MNRNSSNTMFFSVLLALFCQILWGIVFPFIKKCYEIFAISSVGDTLLFASIRFIIAGALLLLMDTIIEKRFPIMKKSEVAPPDFRLSQTIIS